MTILQLVKELACLFAGIHADFVNGLTLHNRQIVWGGRLENYYGTALVCEHVDGLQLDHFTGKSAHPGKVPDKVIE